MSVKFQGDMLNFCDFIQVYVLTTYHHLNLCNKLLERKLLMHEQTHDLLSNRPMTYDGHGSSPGNSLI